MKNYKDNKEIYDKIRSVKAKEGLNGYLMLIHLGTAPLRIDKFHNDY